MTIVLPSLELSVVYAFFAVLIIQLWYYLFFYIRIPLVKRKNLVQKNDFPPVSVIICARNAASQLRKYLPLVLNQDYPEFEVIVVNDSSADDTDTTLIALSKEYEKLRYTTLVKDPKFQHGKKLALTIGIKAAKYDTLCLTDADCYPVTDQWLKSMVGNFTDTKEIVLAYGGYEARNGLLDKFIRYDTLFIAMNYLSFAHAGIPYMGVGRNLAYKKDLFWKNKGFDSHYYLTSGDDDLFINEIASKKNTAIELSEDSITRSFQKKTFKEWFFQKKRHAVTGKLYKKKHKLLLGLEPLSRALLFALLILYLVFQFQYLYWYVIGGVVFRLILNLFVVKLAMNRLNEKKLLLYSPIIDMVLPLFYFILFFTKKNSYYYNRKWN